MSCDWDIHCLTCKESHGFNDFNHAEEFMWLLIKYRYTIAKLEALLNEPRAVNITITAWGRANIDTAWFAEHKDHKLWPMSEYGDLAHVMSIRPPEPEPEPWYFVEGVRYCSKCRTRRCRRQIGGMLPCP